MAGNFYLTAIIMKQQLKQQLKKQLETYDQYYYRKEEERLERQDNTIRLIGMAWLVICFFIALYFG